MQPHAAHLPAPAGNREETGHGPALRLSQVDPVEAWKPWQPADGEWDRKWIAHLYRRAAFGASAAEIEKAKSAQGLPKTLDHLIAGEPDAAERLELLTETGQFYNEPANLRVWWLYAMLEGGHPLREKLTLFWHNHFATSYAKVRSTQLMYEQNVTLRKHALGKFRPFLLDMSKDTAMLVWLDSNRNVKGAPNENYAREVMELFSLGVGNYTEKDIQEAARAFTGWHHDAEVNKFENNPLLHDDGEKTVFGKTGNWTGADVVRICCDQPACAEFLVGKLYAFLVSETAPPRGAARAARRRGSASRTTTSRHSSRTMLASRLFFSRARLPQAGEVAGRVRRWARSGRSCPAACRWPTGRSARQDGAGPVRPAEREGLADRHRLAQQRHAAGPQQLRRDGRDGRVEQGGRRGRAATASMPFAEPTDAAAADEPVLDPAAAGRESGPGARSIYAAKPKDIAAVVKAHGRTRLRPGHRRRAGREDREVPQRTRPARRTGPEPDAAPHGHDVGTAQATKRGRGRTRATTCPEDRQDRRSGGAEGPAEEGSRPRRTSPRSRTSRTSHPTSSRPASARHCTR